MRILITGGAGFIGSHIADAFFNSGNDVALLDNRAVWKYYYPKGMKVFRCDLRDRASVNSFVNGFLPDVVCHHAAQVNVRASVDDPAMDAENNVIGSIHLFEAMRQSGCKRLLFASTGAIYGDSMSPYACAKLAVEHYVNYYVSQHAFKATTFRYANVYGPRQDPHGEAGIVAIFAEKMLKGEAPTVYGDGEQTRDFVYVGDVAQANVLALEKGLVGLFDLGTGIETSVNQILEKLRKLTGFSKPERRESSRVGDPRRSCLDAWRLHEAGWRPATSLEDGLRMSVDFFQKGRQCAS